MEVTITPPPTTPPSETLASQGPPRFVFIHRIGVHGVPSAEIGSYIQIVQQQLNRSSLPLVEYFIPNRDEGAGSYSLTIVDLANMTKLEA